MIHMEEKNYQLIKTNSDVTQKIELVKQDNYCNQISYVQEAE